MTPPNWSEIMAKEQEELAALRKPLKVGDYTIEATPILFGDWWTATNSDTRETRAMFRERSDAIEWAGGRK